MSLTLTWGLAVGIVIALVDLLAREITRGITDTDLAAAIVLLDLLINLGLCGLAGYRVAAARREIRPGLEAAVLAGFLAGAGGLVYQLARGGEPAEPSEIVFLLAWNIVLAAGAGALGAWGGSSGRQEAPPGGDRGTRR
jgi:hypothetical protein